MPICIAGMHRSGTSMVARLLHLCGLYLGPECELMNPSSDNAEGFWENIVFVNLNERILSRLDGSWHTPPLAPDGWESSAAMGPLRAQAEELVQRFASHEPWGWKDPRNSMTAPFWKRVIPKLKIIICARNPLEVVQSLQGRHRHDLPHLPILDLWLHYNQSILRNIPAEARVVTHYESYFHDPKEELRRVLGMLHLPVSEETMDRAVTAVSLPLRHNRKAVQDLLEADLPEDVLKCYMDLCTEAGPVYEAVLQHQPAAFRGVTELRPISSMQPSALGYQDAIRFLRLEAKAAALEADKIEKEQVTRSLQAEKEQAVSTLQTQLAQQEQTLRFFQRQLQDATSSRLWKLGDWLGNFRRRSILESARRACQSLLWPVRCAQAIGPDLHGCARLQNDTGLASFGKRYGLAFLEKSRLAKWLRPRGEPDDALVGPVPRPAYMKPGNLREQLAQEYIRGSGLEIGALHNPLYLPRGVRVQYVDRWETTALHQRTRHPAINGLPLVPVDIVDDGEVLNTVPAESQDFIIANHFLEHVQDPIRTLRRHLEVLKPGGILYLAVPDKRYTFDVRRPVTMLEHLYRDYEEGPQGSFPDHLREWVELVENRTGEAAEARVRQLTEEGYPSIHYHVWTQNDFMEMLSDVRRRLSLPLEILTVVSYRALGEMICVLKKT